jgi:hypothetical protein
MRNHQGGHLHRALRGGATARRIACHAFVVAALLAIAGCDEGRSPIAPTRMMGGIPPAAEGPITITVAVWDFTKTPLPGVLVDVLSPSGPVASGSTDAKGECRLLVSGPGVTVRAQKDGYEPEYVTLPLIQTRVTITLYTRTASDSLRGKYRLTVVPSPACTTLGVAPDQLVYDARVETVDNRVLVMLGPPHRFFVWFGEAGFAGTRERNRITFVITDTMDDGYNFVALHPGAGEVYYAGTVVGEYTNGAILATFDGRIRVSTGPTCQGADHRLELVPSATDDWTW